ncbi:MAG: hypothetical protein QXO25_04730 [Candidatus Bathyarchaeia archaeon]
MSEETAMRGDPDETMNRLRSIVEALAHQSDIIHENNARWIRHVLEMQKDMKFRVDIFRSLEDEVNLQRKIVSGIIDADPSGRMHIPQAISELHELALAALNLTENMKTSDDPELILKIQSANSEFKANLLDYIQYIEMELGRRGEGLEVLDAILEDVNSLERSLPYIFQTED